MVRSSFDSIADACKAAKKIMTMSEIMFVARLQKKYVVRALRAGFIETKDCINSAWYYQITAKGKQYLVLYHELKELLGEK